MTIMIVLGAVLLVCVGLLLGASWTSQALQVKYREHARERRRLDEEWRAVLATRNRWAQRRRSAPPPLMWTAPAVPDHDATPTRAGDPPDEE